MTTCHLCGGERTNPHLSLEAAQAAAQADHDAYIRSALSGAAPQAGEDVAKFATAILHGDDQGGEDA